MRRIAGTRPDPCRALVTGGSGGIGGAVCRALAAQGMVVIVHAGRHLDRAELVADRIQSEGGHACAIAFDLTDTKATARAMSEMLDEGPLPVVVHNAGAHIDVSMAKMRPDDWSRVIDINLNAFYRVVQPALMSMARCRWGRVVAVSSVSARLGNRGQANYAAAKAGLSGAVFALAREMAKRGVTANVVAPGIIDTAMTTELLETAVIESLVPAGRPGTPDEVAALIAFLCSESAAYINAQVIGVDGGMAPG